MGRPVAARDPLGRVIRQEWCACGSLDALVDGKGQRTEWERDLQGRLVREIRADETTDTLYTYETATSRRKTVTDPEDQVTTYTYAADDRVIGLAFSNETIATADVTYTYDAVYPRLTTMVDGTGTTTYGYHAAGGLGGGQLASVNGPLTDDTIAYVYDEVGRMTSRLVDGVGLEYTYDGLGRITEEENPLGVFTYDYETGTSRLTDVTYPNNQTSEYVYDDDEGDHRLLTILHQYPNASTLSKFDYTYDAVGNILTWKQQADSDPAVLWRYEYDAADQLTAAVKESSGGTPTVLKRYAYSYDPAGNRTSEQIDDAIVAATHDEMNRLLTHSAGGPMVFAGTVNEPSSVTIQCEPAVVDGSNAFRGTAATGSGTNTVTVAATDGSGNQAVQQYEVDVSGAGKTFTYDANGNMTSDGTRTFDWDARNQLVAVEVGTHRSEFTYDGLQRRVRMVEKESGVTQSDTKIVWCESKICEERAANGVTVTRRAFGLGEQISGVAHFFATDHLGSVTEVTDGTMTLLARYVFDPWGGRELIAGTDVTTFGFAGYRWQSASNVVLTLYRAYDSEIGRWMSEDPLRLADGPSLYAYVSNNPTRWIDREGLFKTTTQTTSSNSVVCDGSGSTALKIVTNNECIRDCVVAHERSHQSDIDRLNPGICKGVGEGTFIGPDDKAQRDWTESRGCKAELDCLRTKLQTASCECKPVIQRRIQQMTRFCAQWKGFR